MDNDDCPVALLSNNQANKLISWYSYSECREWFCTFVRSSQSLLASLVEDILSDVAKLLAKNHHVVTTKVNLLDATISSTYDDTTLFPRACFPTTTFRGGGGRRPHLRLWDSTDMHHRHSRTMLAIAVGWYTQSVSSVIVGIILYQSDLTHISYILYMLLTTRFITKILTVWDFG